MGEKVKPRAGESTNYKKQENMNGEHGEISERERERNKTALIQNEE